jgi:ATP-dependent helicase HrpB
MDRLPIEEALDKVDELVRSKRHMLVEAPTGSGKSTRLPVHLALRTAAEQGHWVVLQPRRMAARLLASRVAQENGWELGAEVGYAMRHERRYGPATRIVYVTEGWLARKLVSGAGLSGLAGVILDEFHERHLEGDMVLALLRDACRRGVWGGRIVVMSATLGESASRIAEYLGDVGRLQLGGRQFSVARHYHGGGGERIGERVVDGLRSAIRQGAEGDILVFLPGKGEIGDVERRLAACGWARGWQVAALHGELPLDQQRRVVEAAGGMRILLATNVAESSVTLPGVRTVVDSGYERIAGFDPRRGINQLLTVRISVASAEQRAGRAGRVAAGQCWRLWRQADEGLMEPTRAPEIQRLDLAALRLELMAAGLGEQLVWLDAPPAVAWEAAGRQLLAWGAVDSDGNVTSLGRQMAGLPLHPRHSRILLAGLEGGVGDWILPALALLEGRSLLLPLRERHASEARDRILAEADGISDLLREVFAWQWAVEQQGERNRLLDMGLHVGAFHESCKVVRQLQAHCSELGITHGPPPSTQGQAIQAFGRALLSGYPDTVAARVDRGTLRYRRVGGKTGLMRRESVVSNAPFVVSCDVLEQATAASGGTSVLLGLNTAITVDDLAAACPGALQKVGHARIADGQRRVEWVEELRFKDLALESVASEPPPGAAEPLIASALASGDWPLPQWDAKVDAWIARLNTLVRWFPEWELSPFTDDDRHVVLEQLAAGAVSYKQIKERPVLPLIKQWLPEAMLPLMDSHVPERWTFADGRSVKLRYEAPDRVVLSARIQQLYDLPGSTLRICDGRCALLVELLAPNQRPVHITDDLDAFWTGQYPQVRKDLFGRYPKHEWR